MSMALLQIFGFILAFAGFVGLIVSTNMEEWKASSYTGSSILTAQAMFEGLWNTCVSQSTGLVQCKEADSADTRITKSLMILSIIISAMATFLAVAGMKCTTCFAEDEQRKGKVALSGGIIFIIAGLCSLVATSWYGYRITTALSEHHSHSYEFGKALSLGWISAALSILGGVIMCCNFAVTRSGQSRQLSKPCRSKPGMDYV